MLTALLLATAAAAQPAYDSISTAAISADVATLASDEFEGRLPGTKGEELTTAYLEKRFKELGFAPGNPDGTYFQKVPLLGITAQPAASFKKGAETIVPSFPSDYVAFTERAKPEIQVEDSPVVFVGYGVVAPEYGWDDYKDVDVRGKTLLMLVNDPQIPDPKDPSKLDASMFKGKAMTYYGRWMYKYEVAAQKGAAAAVVIHETGPAGYPWEVVANSWGKENFTIRAADGNAGRVAVEAWVSSGTVVKLVSAAGLDFAELKRRALRKDFRPVELGMTADFDLKNSIREIDSRNMLAKIEGADPKLKDQWVIYSAHWDHLGKDPKLKGHQVYSGALDNASGVAAILAIGKAFVGARAKRSILIFAPTTEEGGLLGSRYYAQNPLYPLNKTLADINLDGVNAWGKTKDILSIGLGQTDLDDRLEKAARRRGRVVAGDREPEKGYYYRSDHFEFAKVGVPALNYGEGYDYVGRPKDWGQKKHDEYTHTRYHKPADVVQPDWDWSGAVDDLRLLTALGWDVAQGKSWPKWKAGSEFKARREASGL